MSTSNDDKPSLEARVRALITWPTDGISIDECLEIIDRSMGNSEVLLRELDSLEVNPAGTMDKIAKLEAEKATLAKRITELKAYMCGFCEPDPTEPEEDDMELR